MNLRESDKIYGIPEGVEYGQNARVDELNSRIQDRQLPDRQIRPQFDFRPVATKYSTFPIIDRRPPIDTESRPKYLEYSPETTFAPNIRRGPVEYFVSHIDDESKLRNQFFAIQKGADQGVYVPSSNSDLYKIYVNGRQEEQPFPNISAHFTRDTKLVNKSISPHIGNDLFNNCTRTQLRNTVSM
jgi:hypothetical protein